MNYTKLLQMYKANLTKQLAQRTALIERYAVSGYISTKKIGRKTYKYLQYVDECGELISVYLSKENLQLYEKMLNDKLILENRIQSIKEDLSLFDKVHIQEEPDTAELMLPEEIGGFRLLNHSLGVSSGFHVLFQVIPLDNPSEYEILATYKKKLFRAPMIYVNERFIGHTKSYMDSAGIIIDEAIRKELGEDFEKRSNKIYGITRDGIKYTAVSKGVSFNVSFVFMKEKMVIEYIPEEDYPYMAEQIHRMKISRLIEKTINSKLIDIAMKG